MAIDSGLLEILVCPACHGAVRELPADSGLECAGCGRIYPVRDGFPDALVEDASQPTKGPQTE